MSHKETNEIIKIKVLTKELDFKAPKKKKKNTKTTKNDALGACPFVYNDKIWYL